MNNCEKPHAFSSQELFSFPSLSVEETTNLIQGPMIKTPKTDRMFDPNELMTIDLIETPSNVKSILASSIAIVKDDLKFVFQHTFVSALDIETPSMIEKLNARERIVRHEDFPILLALLNQIKKVTANTKNKIHESIEALANLTKERLEVQNFVIYRGQCPFTDTMIQRYYTMLRCPKGARTTDTTNAAQNMDSIAPLQMFRSQTELQVGQISSAQRFVQDYDLTKSDLIAWAKDFSEISTSTYHKSPVQREKIIKKKEEARKKTKTKKNENKNSKIVKEKNCAKQQNLTSFTDDGSQSSAARTALVHGKKRCAEKQTDSFTLGNKKHRIDSLDNVELSSRSKLEEIQPAKEPLVLPKVEQPYFTAYNSPSLLSQKQGAPSEKAIVLTPHPFKKRETDHFPPSKVITKHEEPLSDITVRSSLGSIKHIRNTFGVRMVIPRVVSSLDATNSSLVIDRSMDNEKRNTVVAEEDNYSRIKKSLFKTINDSGTQTDGKICGFGRTFKSPHSKNITRGKKNVEKDISLVNSPPILSVSFL